MEKNFLDEKQDRNDVDLVVYASGDGSLSFVFQNRHDRNASGVPVTKRDALEYLKRNPHLSGWRVVILSGTPKLYQPVERVAADEVQFGGHSYQYAKVHEQFFHVWDQEGREIQNLNVKGAIMFFVNREQEIEDYERGE